MATIISWGTSIYDASSITIDVTKSFKPNHKAKVSTNPVEKGADKTDHVRAQPFTIEIDGGFSDADNGGRSKDLYDLLVSLQAAPPLELLTVTTPYGSWSDLTISDISPETLEKEYGVIQFKLTLTQVFMVGNIVTRKIQVKIPPKAQCTQEKGQKDPLPADKAVEEKKRMSLADTIRHAIVGK